MNEKEYMKDRVNDQIKWYSSKSSYCKKYFYSLRSIEIIIAAIIPISYYFPYVKTFAPFLSIIIVIIVGLLSLFKFQENWILYRTTSESLKHEKYLYSTKTPPYNMKNQFNIFVNNIESITSSENSLWKQKVGTKKE